MSIFGHVWGLGSFPQSFVLTLSGGLKIKGLEAPCQRRGVDDVHPIVALIFPVESDSHHENGNGDDSGRQARVQGHVISALHT